MVGERAMNCSPLTERSCRASTAVLTKAGAGIVGGHEWRVPRLQLPAQVPDLQVVCRSGQGAAGWQRGGAAAAAAQHAAHAAQLLLAPAPAPSALKATGMELTR